jgi:hypothetical protein
VRSYAKIKGLKFLLRVYSNWVSSSLKKRYFPRWRKCSFVEIVEPEGQTDQNKPTDRRLEGLDLLERAMAWVVCIYKRRGAYIAWQRRD